jgi:hypothetical protein
MSLMECVDVNRFHETLMTTTPRQHSPKEIAVHPGGSQPESVMDWRAGPAEKLRPATAYARTYI